MKLKTVKTSSQYDPKVTVRPRDQETSKVVYYFKLFLPSRVLQKLAHCIPFFSHQASVKEAAGECLFSSASSGCFHLPSKLRKIFTPENQEDNFPSLTVFQRHLDYVIKLLCKVGTDNLWNVCTVQLLNPE